MVTHGTVTLTGQVQSYYEKQVAMTSCQHVAGVLLIIDEIDVEDELGQLSASPEAVC